MGGVCCDDAGRENNLRKHPQQQRLINKQSRVRVIIPMSECAGWCMPVTATGLVKGNTEERKHAAAMVAAINARLY